MEICSLADINRTTFYLHHEDIYELMQCIESDMYRYFKIIFTRPGKEYCQTFFLAGLTAFIQKWLNSGCLESEEELLSLLTRQLSFSRQLLSLLCN